ncbi:class II glutamine amidotransferase [Bifidobacterium miconisargentati]|uniref:class II glutamine amidotransferase n=1 Tax=Bifidobacterium miconisargentati TaxID=2834437 RepID=UPI001BDD60C0|nr:class II glutamine amidotransferase [Bifidobacterium miconisargentati]MBW3089198.1 class II glutamine amidotransferase [Bifidobacterium miconisargentati]
MCVIVTSEAGSMPTMTQLAQMSDTNPDGAGIAWHDGVRLHRYRNEDNHQTLAFIAQHWQFLESVPFLLHFRLATHGKVCVENTHPFRFSKSGRTGFIAHNGIARAHTHGRFESDSRNAILAWQAGQADLSDGSQGRFALIDQNGTLEWLTDDAERIRGGVGFITVSNTNWELGSLIDVDSWWDDGYQNGWEDACVNYGIIPNDEDTLDYMPNRH